jgi:ribosomal protein S12 methylthiotransferase
MKVGFISLGCSKNLIDTEIAIGLFKENKFQIVNKVEEAEIIVVNTCRVYRKCKKRSY